MATAFQLKMIKNLLQNSPTLVTDCDDTTHDTSCIFAEILQCKFPHENYSLEQVIEYNYVTCLGLSPEVIGSIFTEMRESPKFLSPQPKDGLHDFFNFWHKRHGKSDMATSRGGIEIPITQFMVRTTMPYIEDIHFFPKGKPKAPFIREKGYSFYMEDHPGHAEEVALLSPDTIVFLMDMPWNRRQHFPDNVVPAQNWHEIYHYLK